MKNYLSFIAFVFASFLSFTPSVFAFTLPHSGYSQAIQGTSAGTEYVLFSNATGNQAQRRNTGAVYPQNTGATWLRCITPDSGTTLTDCTELTGAQSAFTITYSSIDVYNWSNTSEIYHTANPPSSWIEAVGVQIDEVVGTIATVLKENLFASVVAVLPYLVIAGIVICLVFLAWRFGKAVTVGAFPEPATEDDFERAFERDYPELADKWKGYKN